MFLERKFIVSAGTTPSSSKQLVHVICDGLELSFYIKPKQMMFWNKIDSIELLMRAEAEIS